LIEETIRNLLANFSEEKILNLLSSFRNGDTRFQLNPALLLSQFYQESKPEETFQRAISHYQLPLEVHSEYYLSANDIWYQSSLGSLASLPIRPSLALTQICQYVIDHSSVREILTHLRKSAPNSCLLFWLFSKMQEQGDYTQLY
jgi:hypothetical protein